MISHGISEKLWLVHKEFQNAVKTERYDALSILFFKYFPDIFSSMVAYNKYCTL